MPTSTASWSERGLHYYKGQAWYRTRFEISPAAADRETWLFFCGVDEAATVWLNGELVGTSPGKAFRPFEFEVTSRLRPGQINTLAVRIVNARLDEIGTGGITAPVLLWSPRP